MSTDALTRASLLAFLDRLLEPQRFTDYGPNGLQIEGRDTIERIAFAVSATRASIHAAVDWGAHALIVHHGLFWSFHGVRPITGAFAQRVSPLIRHHINLFGYHLPLDAHLEVGNAAGLARRLGIHELHAFAESKAATLGVSGQLPSALSVEQFQSRLASVTQHSVLTSTPDSIESIRSVGIITGGANRYWRNALDAGLDAYVTGEMSEHDWHEAQEAGICYFAAGHHATERFGVLELESLLASRFSGIETIFLDSENPA